METSSRTPVDPAAVRPAVWSAGFVVEAMRVLAHGAFEEGGRRFRVAGYARSFAVEGASDPAPGPCLVAAEVETRDGEPRLQNVERAGAG